MVHLRALGTSSHAFPCPPGGGRVPAAPGGTRGGPEGSGVLGDLAYGEMLKPSRGGDGRSRGRSAAGKSPGAGFRQDAGLVHPLLPVLCPLCGRRQSCCPCSGCRAGLRHGGSGACGERDGSPLHLLLGRVFLSLIVNRFD